MYTDEQKANALNDFFISVSTINENEPVLPNINLKTNSSLSDIDSNESEITDILKTLDSNKATGPDEISHKMLKGTSSSICKRSLN